MTVMRRNKPGTLERAVLTTSVVKLDHCHWMKRIARQTVIAEQDVGINHLGHPVFVDGHAEGRQRRAWKPHPHEVQRFARVDSGDPTTGRNDVAITTSRSACGIGASARGWRPPDRTRCTPGVRPTALPPSWTDRRGGRRRARPSSLDPADGRLSRCGPTVADPALNACP